ncbi:MAG TPA: copper resistance protein CopC [Dehalococcoidia bacterium]|nr:copper resistance protein CopC [Dehalococcoidia bacterium]
MVALVAIASGVAFSAPFLGTARVAEAHAAYRESLPAFSAELAESPTRLELSFSQQLFRQEGANLITLAGEDGGMIELSAAQIDNADRRRLAVDVLEDLEPGRYLMSWVNLSADDGDDDDGTSSFYVGRSPTQAERDLDRTLAAELLIPYPGDVVDAVVDDSNTTAPPPPTLQVGADKDQDGGVGAGIIVLAVFGGLAAAGVVMTRTNLSARRRD